jgi:hypothetical protein
MAAKKKAPPAKETTKAPPAKEKTKAPPAKETTKAPPPRAKATKAPPAKEKAKGKATRKADLANKCPSPRFRFSPKSPQGRMDAKTMWKEIGGGAEV